MRSQRTVQRRQVGRLWCRTTIIPDVEAAIFTKRVGRIVCRSEQCKILVRFDGGDAVCANASPVLQIDIERQPEKIMVRCTGKVNLESWTLFSRTVRGLFAEQKPIRVDLANVVLVDSTGIGAFVSVWASAKGGGGDLKFINPNKRVQDVVEITKLHDMFENPPAGNGS
jgi:anti-anti-sigma factor